MTNEKIKKNAEKYCEKDSDILNKYGAYGWVFNAYITGAHSRDEEILKLQENIEAMNTYIEAETDCMQNKIKEMQEKLIYLTEELNKFRNLWISISEQQPKKTDVYYVRTQQGCADMAYFDSSIKKWENGRFTDGIVSYWMIIPELKKEHKHYEKRRLNDR